MLNSIQGQRTQPKLLVGMICTAIILITCVSIFSYSRAKRLLTDVTNKNMATVLENSERGRKLAIIFADINILRHTFYGKNEYLKSEGTRLHNSLENIINNTTDATLHKIPVQLLSTLDSFVSHCNEINTIFHTRQNIHNTIREKLQNLEKLLGHLLVKQTLNGKNTTFTEQLLMLVVGYQQSLLEIGKLFAEIQPEDNFTPLETETSPLLIVIDDLILRLQTITASLPEIAKSGKQIIEEMHYYRQFIFQYYKGLEEFGSHVKALDNSKRRLLSEMDNIDRNISISFETLNAKLMTTIFISSTIVLILTIIVVGTLGFLIIKLFQSMDREINERKHAERALKESEIRFRSIFQNVPDAMALTNIDREIVLINPAFINMFGYSLDELEGQQTDILYENREDFERQGRIRFNLRAKEMIKPYPANYKRKNGVIFPGETVGAAIKDDNGNITAFLGVIRDITDRKQAEEDLTKAAFNYRIVADFAYGWEYWQDQNGKFRYVSPSCERITGYTDDEFTNNSLCLEKIIHPDDREIWANHHERAKAVHKKRELRFRIIKKDGGIRWIDHECQEVIDDEGNFLGFRASNRDITESKRLEKQLLQAQKMESIGTLAGGIAHDFNNILSAIIGFSKLAKEDLPEDSSAANDIDEVIRSSCRAADLVQQILTFSRKSDHDLQSFNPHLIVKEVLRMLGSSLPSTVIIHEDIDIRCGKILADPTNIHQIIMNLCTNALHAMEKETGTLTVRLYHREVAAEEIVHESGVSAGPFVVLSVSDTGHGMDKATKERIFEPYFTTKETGKGTGMGLAVIHGIVKDYKGFVRVDSTLGEGSTFSVYIPALEEETSRPEDSALKESERKTTLPTGKGRILVVDDELLLVKINEKQLERYGYTVTGTTDSRDALEKIRAQPEQFDLLITDQTMPGLSGVELAKEVQKIKPTLPIILCTGHSEVFSKEEALAMGINKYVSKPIYRDELYLAIREVLDEI